MNKKRYSFLKNLSSYAPILLVLLLVTTFLLGVTVTKLFSPACAKEDTNIPTAQVPNVPVKAEKVDVATGKFPVLGNKNAKITIVAFADYRCSYCARWFNEVEKNIIKEYVDTGKVKFAFRNYAFLGDESVWAAEAVFCANEQEKFWDFHSHLFTHQQEGFSKETLKSYAKTLGLDTSKFNSCLDTDKYAKDVTEDLTAGKNAGVNGTPTTFVDGRAVVGAQPYDSFKTAIDEALR